MKKIITICAALLMTASLWAQSPEKMSYQAVVRDGNNALVTNQAVGMRIQILQGSEFGAAVYVETQTPTSNANGLVSLEIGAGTLVSGDFTTINWENGPYFIKTETDPTGGTSYTITGTSQLLSVPYALHATTADSIVGGVSVIETDPIFGASVASGITATDTTNWNNKQNQLTAGTNITIVGNTISATVPTNVSAFTNDAGYVNTLNDDDPTNEIQQLSVSATGDTLYLQNGGFVIIPGLSAANTAPPTYPAGTVHCTGTPTAVVEVTNPSTGKIWMDRNLGASQVATSSTDVNSYGDLYQWGRFADGHQCRTSPTTANLSSTDQPGHGDFILAPNILPYDWRSPQNLNLWQGVNGINNPCPSGYRLPTNSELDAERISWSSNDAAGAFASPLKLPMAGYRFYSNGSLSSVGTSGAYWSSTIVSLYASFLYFFSSSPAYMNDDGRALGGSVRCLKD
jgi:uncharacterized protein (TIGR02145 family)